MTLYLLSITYTLSPLTQASQEMFISCNPLESLSLPVVTSTLKAVWFGKWNSSPNWTTFEKSSVKSKWAEILNLTSRSRQSIFNEKNIEMLKVLIYFHLFSFIFFNFHFVFCQFLFRSYLSLCTIQSSESMEMVVNISCGLLEYLQSHTIDPCNNILGAPVSTSLYEAFFPFLELPPTSNSLSDSEVLSLLMRWSSLDGVPGVINKEINSLLTYLKKPMLGVPGDIIAIHGDGVSHLYRLDESPKHEILFLFLITEFG